MAYRILVADDEPPVRNMLEMLLAADGHEVTSVADGQAALEFLKEHTPDVMLLDVRLPLASGYDICGRVKRIKRLRDVPVVLLATHDDDQARDQSRLVGADDLIIKPLSGKNIRGRVTQLVAGKKTLDG